LDEDIVEGDEVKALFAQITRNLIRIKVLVEKKNASKEPDFEDNSNIQKLTIGSLVQPLVISTQPITQSTILSNPHHPSNLKPMPNP